MTDHWKLYKRWRDNNLTLGFSSDGIISPVGIADTIMSFYAFQLMMDKLHLSASFGKI